MRALSIVLAITIILGLIWANWLYDFDYEKHYLNIREIWYKYKMLKELDKYSVCGHCGRHGSHKHMTELKLIGEPEKAPRRWYHREPCADYLRKSGKVVGNSYVDIEYADWIKRESVGNGVR